MSREAQRRAAERRRIAIEDEDEPLGTRRRGTRVARPRARPEDVQSGDLRVPAFVTTASARGAASAPPPPPDDTAPTRPQAPNAETGETPQAKRDAVLGIRRERPDRPRSPDRDAAPKQAVQSNPPPRAVAESDRKLYREPGPEYGDPANRPRVQPEVQRPEGMGPGEAPAEVAPYGARRPFDRGQQRPGADQPPQDSPVATAPVEREQRPQQRSLAASMQADQGRAAIRPGGQAIADVENGKGMGWDQYQRATNPGPDPEPMGARRPAGSSVRLATRETPEPGPMRPTQRPDRAQQPEGGDPRSRRAAAAQGSGSEPATKADPGAEPITPDQAAPTAAAAAQAADDGTAAGDVLADAVEDEATGRGDDAEPALTYMEAWQREGLPVMVEHYTKTGQFKEAEELMTFGRSVQFQNGVKRYASAALAAGRGDLDGFVEHMEVLFDDAEWNNDGVSIVQDKTSWILDDAGEITGAQITFEDDDGEQFNLRYDSLDEAVTDMLTAMSPEAALQRHLAQVDGANEARLNAAQKEAEFATFAREEMLKAGLESTGGIDADTVVERALEMVESDPTLMGADPEVYDAAVQAAVQRVLQAYAAAGASVPGGNALGAVRPTAPDLMMPGN